MHEIRFLCADEWFLRGARYTLRKGGFALSLDDAKTIGATAANYEVAAIYVGANLVAAYHDGEWL